MRSSGKEVETRPETSIVQAYAVTIEETAKNTAKTLDFYKILFCGRIIYYTKGDKVL
ncbi:MAG: hypothetical protein HFG43_15930 [Lachnospiraceae bacterium]|jgi:hypothetical protein|nr:hypothetical protein [Lachnospiraceae bacterium]